jgi:hypothetical protein
MKKAYINENHDGRRSAMVAANTLAHAAKRLSTTVHAMREYGWVAATDGDLALALANPDTIFYRPITGSRGWTAGGPVTYKDPVAKVEDENARTQP